MTGQETARLRESVTLCLTEIRTADPLPMIPHQVETQFIASQPFPVSITGILIPSPSAAPGSHARHAPETLAASEYPLNLGCQKLALQDPPQTSPN